MSRIFRVISASIFILGALAWKVAVEKPIIYDRLDKGILAGVIKALTEKGFIVPPLPDKRVVMGVSERCTVWIAQARPEGGDDGSFASIYGQYGKVLFWYKGELLSKRPGTRGLLDRYLERLKVVFGRTPEIHPIYQIVANSQCDKDLMKSLEIDTPSI